MKLFIFLIALVSIAYAFPGAPIAEQTSAKEEQTEVQEPAESGYYGGWSHGLGHGWSDGLYGGLHGYSTHTHHGHSGLYTSPRVIYHTHTPHYYRSYATPHYYGGWSRGWW